MAIIFSEIESSAGNENAGKPIYATFCARAVFLPDRMSLVLSLEMDWPPWHPRDPTNCALSAPTLLLNTIRLLHPQPQAVLFHQQATQLSMFDREGCGGRSEATVAISSLPLDRRRKFLCSCPSASSQDQLPGRQCHICALLLPLCPSFTSNPPLNPTHSLTTCTVRCTGLKFPAPQGAQSKRHLISSRDLRSHPSSSFFVPTHLVRVSLGKDRES